MVSQEKLQDKTGRSITYLRLSVTDRCNLKCQYCMPQNNFAWLSHEEILRFEEIQMLCQAFAELGIRKIRLTGGEPLVRKDIVDLAGMVSGIESIEEVCLTTNGVLLEKFAQDLFDAGITHINISLDTLKPERFFKITGRDCFSMVWSGIKKAIGLFAQVKINSVVMKGINDDEVVELAGLSLTYPVQIRFIEFMSIGQCSPWHPSLLVSCDKIKEKVENGLGALDPVPSGKNAGPAAIYKLPGSKGNIGFITPVSRHFCATCNRVRITPDGKLRLCLFSDKEIDLKTSLRQGITQEELTELLREAILRKPVGYKEVLEKTKGCQRSMSRIGG